MKISKVFLFSVILIAFTYLFLAIYFQNIALINSTIVAPDGFVYKIALLSALIQGFSSTMNGLQFMLFVITGLLIGINLSLIIQRVGKIKKIRKGYFMAGGSSLLGIFGGGCVSCGLPFLSILGLSGAIVYLPFKGAELPYISIGLLVLSFYFLVKKSNTVCKIENKKRLSVVPARE